MKIPENINDCFLELRNMININKWFNISENEALSISHYTIGLKIRNNWKLWESDSQLYIWFKNNNINHPEDMSTIIIRSFYRHINNIDINLEKQINDVINRKNKKLKLK